MNLNLATLLITAIGAICLGIAVYQRTPDRVWNRIFGVHAALAGTWTFVIYLVMSANTASEAGLFLRLTHPFGAMAICTVVDFVWVFPDKIDYALSRRRLALYACGMAVATVSIAPNLYHSIELSQGIVQVQYGWPLIPFGLFSLGALLYADVVLLRKVMRLSGVQRVQVAWVLIGLAGTHLWGLVTIIVIPLLGGGTDWSGWGPVGLLSTQAGMGYAIAKHRLMRPGVALRRLAVSSLSVSVVLALGVAALSLAAPYMRAHSFAMSLVYMIAGLVMGMIIVLIHERITGRMREWGRTGADPAVVQAETESQILRTLDVEQLLDLLARSLNDAIEPSRVSVYTWAPQVDLFIPRVTLKDGRGNGDAREAAPIERDHPILELVARDRGMLTRDHIFRFASLEHSVELSAAMDQLEVQLVAPMIWEDELIGVVGIGPKRSGEMYSDGELRFVADMALQASLALRNADLYAETAALKDFNERILTQMDNAVIVTDDRERILVFNAAAERLFQIEMEEARGSSIDLLPDGIAACIRESLCSGQILSSRQVDIQGKDRVIPIGCSTSPLTGEGQASQGAVAVISDLTLIQELDRERQEAERLQLIRVISAGMAHEIRNPLVAIRTFAELAPRRLDDPDFRSNFLTVAQQEIGRIDKLVSDLLTLSKPAEAVVEPVDLRDLCEQVMRSMGGMAEKKGIALRLDLGELEAWPMGDETRLHQALLNLARNAVDAEPPDGVVTLSLAQRVGERGTPVASVRVHNAGSYIPPDQTEEIFRPFVSKKAQGTGLGLAICQTIIEEHNGRISVSSGPGEGTAFTVEIPLTASLVASTAGEK